MPHDINGQPLQSGDEVLVPCKVITVHPGIDYCNLSLETIEPMAPGTYKSQLTLNTKQVKKVLP